MRGGKKNMKSILKQLFPSAPSSEIAAAGGRVLKQLHAAAPEDIEEFRFRPGIRLKAESLRVVDQYVLTAVWLLRGEGHMLSISRKVTELMSKECNPGALFVSLDRLEEQGLISSRTMQIEDRPRRFFTITETGTRVVAQVSPAQQAIEKLGYFA